MVEQQIALAAQNLIKMERSQAQVVALHPVIFRMPDDACVMSRVDAASFVINNRIEGIFR